MAWSEPDPVGDRGFETTFLGRDFAARLVFDCHHEPRKLEVSLDAGRAGLFDALVEHLTPFAPPQVISAGQLVIFDRAGYFRLLLIPGRLQALLRKDAPLQVVAELLAQLARAHGASEPPPHTSSDCAAGAIRSEGVTHIDAQRCTRCLDCVRPYARAELLPSRTPPSIARLAPGGARSETEPEPARSKDLV
ncbi:MAG: hypothetical protein U1A78_20265 [Polyangia bacterium]